MKGKMKHHYTSKEIRDRLAAAPDRRVVITLQEGESTWRSGSTSDKRQWGPATVTYQTYPDGGVDMRVS